MNHPVFLLFHEFLSEFSCNCLLVLSLKVLNQGRLVVLFDILFKGSRFENVVKQDQSQSTQSSHENIGQIVLLLDERVLMGKHVRSNDPQGQHNVVHILVLKLQRVQNILLDLQGTQESPHDSVDTLEEPQNDQNLKNSYLSNDVVQNIQSKEDQSRVVKSESLVNIRAKEAANEAAKAERPV